MTTQTIAHSLVIDIGKTHVKLHVLDSKFNSLFSKQMKNTVVNEGVFPSINTKEIWDWLIAGIKEITPTYRINAINITTHGATAALIDRNSISADGLVLPILDYEYTGVYEQSPEYESIRPSFDDTFSPSLPAGLNLGRQLYWLKTKFGDEFKQVTDILMYPQYWVWRFTGQRVNEITSLGCHTDLWSIKNNSYSSLVDYLDCEKLLPKIEPAWFDCGQVTASLITELGLDPECHFYNGIHDSNASFLRYKLTQKDTPFTVVSTGTWTILMSSQVSLSNLDAKKDMLANIDAMEQPIACARFMGGREFEAICEQAGSWLGEQFNVNDIQNVIDEQVFAIPDFSDGSGPFGGAESGFISNTDKVSGIALATIYCALMIDYQLDMLDAKGDIFIEGAFLKNPLLCAVLNQLRDNNNVILSMDSTGTVQGAGYLSDWGNVQCEIECEPSTYTNLTSLKEYQKRWRSYAEAKLNNI
ncbi:FGGY-family carbohydrate kinase [Pseudoalteromonas sp. ZZD1]|uniref:FGGY-family carbohydrate kinase n=1 Tax=Pseudoalteromonas sp. ZZD1 TaxID=3139395 RepID=UPI003BAC1497